MKIAIIGKFSKLHDEEYIARSFEMLGHSVIRIEFSNQPRYDFQIIERELPDVVVWGKLKYSQQTDLFIKMIKDLEIPTVCWLFDLYFDYHREFLVKVAHYFKADYVATTDGGHDERWLPYGIKHKCIRQGIYRDECVLLPFKETQHDVVFVGSDNPIYPERTKMVRNLSKKYNLSWFGRVNTDELRGMELNEVYSKTKIVVGDSYYSPHYWSNRVVETLGRGGFLIHRDVPGLKEEYPYIVTYNGTEEDLCAKIDYYLEHEDERREIVRKNFEWVRDNYTMDKKCKELLEWVT